jgi:hypothetical protein
MCNANALETCYAKKIKPRKHNDHYNNLGKGGHQNPLLKSNHHYSTTILDIGLCQIQKNSKHGVIKDKEW